MNSDARIKQLRIVYKQLNALLDPEEVVLFPVLDHLGDLIRQVESVAKQELRHQVEARGAL